MRESDIKKLFAQEEDVSYGSPVHQDNVYIIMWQSELSGGTYTALRKSIQGKNRFLVGLRLLGVDLKTVNVVEQKKTWVPVPKSEQKKEAEQKSKRGRKGKWGKNSQQVGSQRINQMKMH